jgi:N4-gp56 family major capsid protein
MSVITSSTFSGASINAHIAGELLTIAQKSVIFQQLGEKAKMPPGEGKTFQFNRYERLSLPLVTLTEGTPPSSTNMSLTTVQAVADQWGAYVAMSDVAQLTIKHPILATAMELLGYQAAELVDREIIKVLLAGTSVTYGGTATTRSGLATASSDQFVDKVAQRAVARLRTRGAIPYEGQHFVGVIDPNMEQDVSQAANSAFLYASAYNNVKQFLNGELGTWRGVRWMTSNFIPTITGLAAATVTSPASPAGTFTGANYRVSVAAYDASTGFLKQITQNAAIAFTAADSAAVTIPSDANYVYKIFIGLAAGAATDIMYQGVESTYGTGYIPAAASAVVLAPPVAGDSLSGGDVPGTGKIIHLGWVFGKQAYCVVDLQNLQTFVSKPEATVADPLLQQRTVGYKLMFKAVIQNNNFMERIEVMSEFD